MDNGRIVYSHKLTHDAVYPDGWLDMRVPLAEVVLSYETANAVLLFAPKNPLTLLTVGYITQVSLKVDFVVFKTFKLIFKF